MDKVTGVFLYFYPQASFIHAWRCDIAICLREELSGLHISSTYIHFMSSLERKISEWYSSVCIIETRQSSELRKSEELGEEAVHLEVFAHSLWKFLIEEDTLKKKKKSSWSWGSESGRDLCLSKLNGPLKKSASPKSLVSWHKDDQKTTM